MVTTVTSCRAGDLGDGNIIGYHSNVVSMSSNELDDGNVLDADWIVHVDIEL